LSENPLLPHSKLRELHALMVRSRALTRKQTPTASAREALLAATLIHLLPGDLLSPIAGDGVVAALAPDGKNLRAGSSLVSTSAFDSRLTVCAAAARGVQASGTDGLVLAFAKAGAPEQGWQSALEWAHTSQLPLLLACSDATNGASSPAKSSSEPALDFLAMTRFAKRHKLPILTVDGEDAVAVYRVMQESVLRARQGGGPAVLWAVMTPTRSIATLPASGQPIARLRRYFTARKIPLHP
jgi:TPP-dependent pyruvate/acetoin dehydrogenase alpha subunit